MRASSFGKQGPTAREKPRDWLPFDQPDGAPQNEVI